MYKMRNIHEEPFPGDVLEFLNIGRSVMDERDNVGQEFFRLLKTQKDITSNYRDLETRQNRVLHQLAELKKQVSTLCQFLKQSNGIPKLNENTTVKATTDCVSPQEPVRHIKMIVHADPDYLPYSVLALQKLWNDVDIRVTSYKHSSITASTQFTVPFQKSINSTAKTIIHLTLIWKQTKDLEVIIVDGCNIIGESNFLRYLSRLVDTHNYEKIHTQPHLLDTVLDWCYKTYEHLKTGGTYKEVDFNTVTRHFEKWANQPEPNIADFALWSLFKRFPPERKPKILDRWYDSCEKAFIDKVYA